MSGPVDAKAKAQAANLVKALKEAHNALGKAQKSLTEAANVEGAVERESKG